MAVQKYHEKALSQRIILLATEERFDVSRNIVDAKADELKLQLKLTQRKGELNSPNKS